MTSFITMVYKTCSSGISFINIMMVLAIITLSNPALTHASQGYNKHSKISGSIKQHVSFSYSPLIHRKPFTRLNPIQSDSVLRNSFTMSLSMAKSSMTQNKATRISDSIFPDEQPLFQRSMLISSNKSYKSAPQRRKDADDTVKDSLSGEYDKTILGEGGDLKPSCDIDMSAPKTPRTTREKSSLKTIFSSVPLVRSVPSTNSLRDLMENTLFHDWSSASTQPGISSAARAIPQLPGDNTSGTLRAANAGETMESPGALGDDSHRVKGRGGLDKNNKLLKQIALRQKSSKGPVVYETLQEVNYGEIVRQIHRVKRNIDSINDAGDASKNTTSKALPGSQSLDNTSSTGKTSETKDLTNSEDELFLLNRTGVQLLTTDGESQQDVNTSKRDSVGQAGFEMTGETNATDTETNMTKNSTPVADYNQKGEDKTKQSNSSQLSSEPSLTHRFIALIPTADASSNTSNNSPQSKDFGEDNSNITTKHDNSTTNPPSPSWTIKYGKVQSNGTTQSGTNATDQEAKSPVAGQNDSLSLQKALSPAVQNERSTRLLNTSFSVSTSPPRNDLTSTSPTSELNVSPISTSEPIPEPNHSSAPSSEPAPTSEPESEPDSEPEPEPETEPEPEPEHEPFPSPEPGPEWDKAKQKWDLAWEIHVYGIGGLFAAVGFYTLISLLRLWRIPRLLSRGYFLSLNFLMLGLCGVRAFYLLYDSYNSGGTYMINLDYFLYSIAFPFLSSAFSILLYSLLKATNMQLVSPSVQRLPILLFIIVVHFGLSIASDVLVGYFAGAQVVLFVCQMYFIVWGLFLFIGYTCVFRRLYAHSVKRQKNTMYTSNPAIANSTASAGGSNGSLTLNKVKGRIKYTLTTAVKVTFFTALCGIMTIGLELYGIVGVYKTFTFERPEPWPWYLYHTTLRLLELFMCMTMSYVASQPFRYRLPERSCCTCSPLCLPCCEMLCCAGRYGTSGPVDRQHHQQHSAASCSWSDLDIAPGKLHSTRIRHPQDNEQLQGYAAASPAHARKSVTAQPTNGKPPLATPSTPTNGGSLLIVEDGFIRFQSGNDISHVVNVMDSHGKKTHKGSAAKANDDIHNANTLPLRESAAPVVYSHNFDAIKLKEFRTNAPDDGVDSSKYDADKSRKSSLISGDFFRVPSSVSLADSLENELEKAFESFHLDASQELEIEIPNRAANIQTVAEVEEDENNILDITGVSELANMKETDLISVDSQNEPDYTYQKVQRINGPYDHPNAQNTFDTIDSSKHHSNSTPHHQPHAIHSSRRPFILLRRAKSSEVNDTSHGAATPQKLKRSFSDQPPRASVKSETSSARYTHLLDMDSTDSKLSNNSRDISNVFVARRPDKIHQSEPASVTRSLLKSSSSNDNIEV